MKIQTYDELIAPDPRNTMVGFMEARIGGRFDMQVAARVVEGYVSYIDLVPEVPESLVSSYERVRRVFSYGLFDYDLFTVAREQAVLLLEQALRERFIALYEGEVTLVRVADRHEDRLRVSDFETLWGALNRRGSHAKGDWTVKLRSGDLLV